MNIQIKKSVVLLGLFLLLGYSWVVSILGDAELMGLAALMFIAQFFVLGEVCALAAHIIETRQERRPKKGVDKVAGLAYLFLLRSVFYLPSAAILSSSIFSFFEESNILVPAVTMGIFVGAIILAVEYIASLLFDLKKDPHYYQMFKDPFVIAFAALVLLNPAIGAYIWPAFFGWFQVVFVDPLFIYPAMLYFALPAGLLAYSIWTNKKYAGKNTRHVAIPFAVVAVLIVGSLLYITNDSRKNLYDFSDDQKVFDERQQNQQNYAPSSYQGSSEIPPPPGTALPGDPNY